MTNYQEEFPLPFSCIPETLKKLLTPSHNIVASQSIVVTEKFERNKSCDNYECLNMIMACVPEQDVGSLTVLRESSDGVVNFSKPICSNKGGIYPLNINISGYDYIIASWGDSSHFSFSLAEKVWMTLGLSARVIGNDEQKIIYDDLSLPLIGVAEGQVATEYLMGLKKEVQWCIRNDYLRKYLWMTGTCGVRVFFYESYIEATDAVLNLLAGDCHYNKSIGNGWGELDISRKGGRILLQMWASVCALEPLLCQEQDVYSLIWPDDSSPITKEKARSFIETKEIYLDDRFLEKYERDNAFELIPFKTDSHYGVCPSYKGQWALNGCYRVGRNLLKVSLYELYKGLPEGEIYHAHEYAIKQIDAESRGLSDENIVCKVDRLLNVLMDLGDNFQKIHDVINKKTTSKDLFIDLDRSLYVSEGFRAFPVFIKLMQVSSLSMYEQDFLSRCKTLNEIINRFKVGALKRLLLAMSAESKQVGNLQVLKLLQAFLNITEELNDQGEGTDALINSASVINWKRNNDKFSPLFVNNDLRNSEAHEDYIGQSLDVLKKIGFDTSSVKNGYGKALDFILDGINDGLSSLNENITKILNR